MCPDQGIQTIEPLDILAFSPHPDDAELGCGGSLLMASDMGRRVAIADLSDGERASRGSPEQRQCERQKSAELLGLCERFALGLPDTEIGLDPANTAAAVELIRKTRPRIVLAPYWSDRHPDHEEAGRLIRRACFLAGVAAVGRGRVHRPERLFHYMTHSPFVPSFIMDITSVWERKKGVIEIYESQFAPPDADSAATAISQPAFWRFQEARSVYFGAMIGVAYGEPFVSTAPLPTRSLPGMDDFQPPPGALPPYCALY
jgi:bacillithiol biosynthesis deacetylase BshB1